jgi:hypothetical protein
MANGVSVGAGRMMLNLTLVLDVPPFVPGKVGPHQ